jgi:hypothetical protein
VEGHILEDYRSTHYTGGNEVINGLREWFAVVHRIDPEHGIIRNRKARVFEAHQRDVIDKREIARNPSAGLYDDRGSEPVKHNANFNTLSPVFKLQYPQHGLVERGLGLYDVIMDIVDRRVDRDCGDQLRMFDVSPGVHNLRVGKRSAVCEHLNGRTGKLVAALLKDADKILPVR